MTAHAMRRGTETPALTVPDICARLKGVRRSGEGYIARCPAHDDTTASLKIDTAPDGRTLLFCHAGCDFKSIVSALGATPDELSVSNGRQTVRGHTTERFVEAYIYRDEDDQPLCQVLRYDILDASGRKEAKTFKQQRHIGGGEFEWGMKPAPRRVPYHLSEVLQAIAEERTIYVVEGEKDVDRLRAEGLAATCNIGGACNWRDEDSAPLVGAHVVILPDNDESGRKHAELVRLRLQGVAERVSIVALPDLPAKGDVSDYLDAGHTMVDLLTVVDEATKPPRAPFLTDLEIEDLPDLEYLVPDLVPAGGLVELVGPPGSGKSFFMLGMACSVATGIPFLGRVVMRGPALYATAEGVSGMGARTRAWKAENGISLGRCIGVSFRRTVPALCDEADVARFIAEVQMMDPLPLLIVIDTLARAMAGYDENSTADMTRAMEGAAAIQRATRAAVGLVHHPIKSGETYRGNSANLGALDTLLLLRNDGGRLRLECAKQKDADEFLPIDIALKIVGSSCVITPKDAGGSPFNSIGPGHRKLAEALTTFSAEGGASYSRWLAASGVSDSSFDRLRNDLHAWGYVALDKKGRGGRYSLTLGGELLLTPNPQLTPNSPPRGDATFATTTPLSLKSGGDGGKRGEAP